VKTSELRRWLKSQGCTFEEGTRHTIVSFKGRLTTLPRHPSREIAMGTYKQILKDLGLKEKGNLP
jgi:mRNA interferase HicA